MHVGSEKVKTRLGERSLSTQWLQNPNQEMRKKRNRSRRKHKGRRARYYSGDE